VEIVVVVQGGRIELPDRADLRVVHVPTIGVASSRNEVLRAARGEIVLFGDDDVIWDWRGIEQVLSEFARDPQLALVMARAVDGSNALRKRYHPRRTKLNRWNSARAATYELLVRRDSFVEAGIWFDESFGAGMPNHLGDEYVLITDAVAAGLRCEALPIVIACHPDVSSGLRYGTDADTRARVAVFARVFGSQAWFARVLFWLRRPFRFRTIEHTLAFLLADATNVPRSEPTRLPVPSHE
jgi:hypothetical protein